MKINKTNSCDWPKDLTRRLFLPTTLDGFFKSFCKKMKLQVCTISGCELWIFATHMVWESPSWEINIKISSGPKNLWATWMKEIKTHSIGIFYNPGHTGLQKCGGLKNISQNILAIPLRGTSVSLFKCKYACDCFDQQNTTKVVLHDFW